MEQDLIITKITRVRRKTIYRTKPWIAARPRPAMAVAVVRDGVLLHQTDEGTFPVAKGEVLVVTPGKIDGCTSEGESATYDYVDFFANDSFSLSEDGIAMINHFEHTQKIFELFDKIRFTYESRQPDYMLRCKELLYAIFYQIAHEKHKNNEEHRRYRRIMPAILQIQREFDKPLNCNELAKLCGLSASSLNRLFMTTTGSTPMQYLHNTRIEFAKEELARGIVSIGELAERCGYSDIYAFSHAFKRATGVAPSEWH